MMDISTAFDETRWTDVSPDGQKLVNYADLRGQLRISFVLFDKFWRSGHMIVPVSGTNCALNSYWYSGTLDIDVVLQAVCAVRDEGEDPFHTVPRTAVDYVGINLELRESRPISPEDFSDIRFRVPAYSVLRYQNPTRPVFPDANNGVALKFGPRAVRLAGIECDAPTGSWLKRNDLTLLAANTDEFALLVAFSERTDVESESNSASGIMRMRVYDKVQKRWSEQAVDWYALPRVLDDWVVVRGVNAAAGIINETESTQVESSHWHLYPDERERLRNTGSYGGSYWFWNPRSGEVHVVTLDGPDSEVLEIVGDTVFFRQGESLKSARLIDNGFRSTETLWIDEVVPMLNFLTTMEVQLRR
ncbi:MAG: hypothetical protein AAFY69_11320 [Pseudomonadota bacterium]